MKHTATNENVKKNGNVHQSQSLLQNVLATMPSHWHAQHRHNYSDNIAYFVRIIMRYLRSNITATSESKQ